MEHLKLLAGLNAEHVPYRGVAPMLTDLLAGRVHYTLGNLPDVLQPIADGRLVGLGIVAGARHRLLPDLATFAELGFPQLVSDTWYGVMMPAGARPEVKAVLSAALLDTIGRPATRTRLAEIGLDVLAQGAEPLTGRIRRGPPPMRRWSAPPASPPAEADGAASAAGVKGPAPRHRDKLRPPRDQR
jgi:tripartite-type tricarboxylate transporter receptor subunit TctC